MTTSNRYCIPTTYQGTRFRSKSEAITAQFFDTHRIHWVYEPEGFAVNGICYLPDFYLPAIKTFVEVKPVMFLKECTKFYKFMEVMRESYRAWILTVENQKVFPVSMLTFYGEECPTDDGWSWFDVEHCYGGSCFVDGRYLHSPGPWVQCTSCLKPFIIPENPTRCPHCGHNQKCGDKDCHRCNEYEPCQLHFVGAFDEFKKR